MNDPVFRAMQDQMVPSDEASQALRRRLAETAPAKRGISRLALGALAACAVLAVLAWPVYQSMKPKAPALHSYVLSDGVGALTTDGSKETGFFDGAAQGTTVVSGEDQGVQPGTEDHFTGEFTGEADLPVQENAMAAYQNLMLHFEAEYGPDRYPDWYGGAWLSDREDTLVVNVVQREGDPAPDKSFYLQIEGWADSSCLSFAEVKYSLGFLRDLQRQVTELPELAELSSWACGVDEFTGRLELTVPRVDDPLLAALARLDPADDAILVLTGEIGILEQSPATGTVSPVPGD